MSNINPTPAVTPVVSATPVAPKAAEAPAPSTSGDSKVDFWANAWANRGK